MNDVLDPGTLTNFLPGGARGWACKEEDALVGSENKELRRIQEFDQELRKESFGLRISHESIASPVHIATQLIGWSIYEAEAARRLQQ